MVPANTVVDSSSAFVCDNDDTSIAADAVVIAVRQVKTLVFFDKLSVRCGRLLVSRSLNKAVETWM